MRLFLDHIEELFDQQGFIDTLLAAFHNVLECHDISHQGRVGIEKDAILCLFHVKMAIVPAQVFSSHFETIQCSNYKGILPLDLLKFKGTDPEI